MRLSKQFQVCLFIYLFFLRKILNAQKHNSSKNQLKNKNKETKYNKDNNFLRKKLLRGRNCLFYVLVLFVRLKLLRRKYQHTSFCLDSLIYYTTKIIHIQERFVLFCSYKRNNEISYPNRNNFLEKNLIVNDRINNFINLLKNVLALFRHEHEQHTNNLFLQF